MSLPFSLFLALKYLKPKRTLMSVISVISVLGVTLGVAVLVIVLSIMSGFDDMWREKILGFDAHVLVTCQGIIERHERMLEKIRAVPGVAEAAPCVQGLVFARHADHIYTPMMRGIDPAVERRMNRLHEHMVAGKFELGESDAIVGSELARRLRLRVNDRFLLFSPQTLAAGRDEVALPLEFNVAGVFEIGMWEYDVGFVLLPLDAAMELYGLEDGVHAVRVTVFDPFRAAKTAASIAESLRGEYPDVVVQTWMDLNRQLFDALRVEKNMMFFILIFIVLVAAFGITNTLIVVVVQKTKEIGLLKAVGFSSGSVMRVFFWQGWIQGVIGTGCGIILGLVMLRYRQAIMDSMSAAFGMEMMPKELYHLSEIPSHTSCADVLLIALISIAICTLAGFIPAWRASRLDPAEALRYE